MARVHRLGPQAQPSFLLACTQPRVAWTCSVHRVCRRQRCTPYFQVAARRAACTRPCFRTARHDSGLVRTETIQDTRLVALRRALFRSTHGRRRHGHQSPFVLFPPRVFDARRRLAFSRYCHAVLGSTVVRRDVFRLEVFEWPARSAWPFARALAGAGAGASQRYPVCVHTHCPRGPFVFSG